MPNLGKGGKLTYTLYDSVAFDGTQTVATLFTNPLSGTKNKYRTNMRLASQLSTEMEFEVKALSFAPAPDAEEGELAEILKGYFEFWVGGEIWFEAPIFIIPAGEGQQVYYDVGSAGTGALANNGIPSSRNIFDLTRKIKIKSSEEFRVDLVYGTAPSEELKLWCYLYGELTTPLQ